jgi:MFS family permease
MLLQYFTRGAWFVTLGTYLGKSMEQPGTFIGFSYSLFGIGAIISPFFVGIVADRFFPTQRVLGVLNIAAGVIMLILSQITDPTTFLWALFIYCIIYTPTEALSNSIVFHHMPRRYFAYIRLFGTIGWVFAGLAVNMLLGKFIPNVEATAVPLIMSAVASAILGIYNFTLPPTPVKNKGEKIGIKEVFGFEALSLLKQRNFSIFLGASLLIGIPIQMYFAFFNMFLNDIGVSNVAWMIGRVGLKWMMSLGLAFWSIRYFLFAGISVNAEYLIIFSILIHGACYDFFNVTGSIYVDLKAGERYRSAAQGLFMLVFLGLGKFFGSNLAGFISTKNPSTVEGFLYDWSGIFNTTGIITAAITVLFIFSFHDKQKYDLNKDN